MYMPTVARFTARDPLPQNGEPVLFPTPYWYGNNSPALSIDPSGMLTITGIEPFPDAKCGAHADYTWDFELAKKPIDIPCPLVGAGRGGYFVQRVEIWCENATCPTTCGEDCPNVPE